METNISALDQLSAQIDERQQALVVGATPCLITERTFFVPNLGVDQP
jgi:hypothetical protein